MEDTNEYGPERYIALNNGENNNYVKPPAGIKPPPEVPITEDPDENIGAAVFNPSTNLGTNFFNQ